MELTIANDFQNNLDHSTINSFVSHLADTMTWLEQNIYSKARNEKIQFIQKIHQKAQRFLKSLEPYFA